MIEAGEETGSVLYPSLLRSMRRASRTSFWSSAMSILASEASGTDTFIDFGLAIADFGFRISDFLNRRSAIANPKSSRSAQVHLRRGGRGDICIDRHGPGT